MSKFSQFHPYLAKLLTKLADKKYSVQDITTERLDWVWAGCPIEKTRTYSCRGCGSTESCPCGYTG